MIEFCDGDSQIEFIDDSDSQICLDVMAQKIKQEQNHIVLLPKHPDNTNFKTIHTIKQKLDQEHIKYDENAIERYSLNTIQKLLKIAQKQWGGGSTKLESSPLPIDLL